MHKHSVYLTEGAKQIISSYTHMQTHQHATLVIPVQKTNLLVFSISKRTPTHTHWVYWCVSVSVPQIYKLDG